jgi:uncharacterized protein YqeY
METIQKDITSAMRAREERRLSTLRMIKTALKNKEIEKMSALTDAEAIQILGTLIKQRKDSIEQFTRGNRPELAEKEAAEIPLIEAYMPKAVSEEEIRGVVQATIGEMGTPTIKEMGLVMKNVMAKFQAQGARAEGKLVSEIVKQEIGKQQAPRDQQQATGN